MPMPPAATEAPPHYVVDASNVTASGPVAVVGHLVPELLALPGRRWTVLLPDAPWAQAFEDRDRVRVIRFRRAAAVANGAARFWRLHVTLPHLARRLRPSAWLTLGDVGPIALPCPHVMFLHLAALAYSPDELVGIPVWSPAKRRYLQWHFGAAARRAATVVVQTPVMAARVRHRYALPAGRVVEIAQPAANARGNALDQPGAESALRSLLTCEKPIRLLFLAAYYPHKNHQLLPALARELRNRGLGARVHIFTTLAADDERSAALRGRLASESDLITNLGALQSSHVPVALRASTALFLPTLLESFGLPYLEAMAQDTRIVTSDRDFARWMCGECAEYFDPTDPVSAADAIERAAAPAGSEWITRVAEQRSAFPRDWAQVARSFVATLARASGAPA